MTLMARRRMLVRFSARPASGRIREARVIEGGEGRCPGGRKRGRYVVTASRAVSWVPAMSGRGPGGVREGSGDRSCEARDRRAPVGKGSKR